MPSPHANAEIALKIGDTPTYKDGDVLAAFSRRRIRCVHAQHLCRLEHGAKGTHRPMSHMARRYREKTAQYRFERVSTTEVRRVTLATFDEVIFDGTPKMVDGKMQHMAVAEFVGRRLDHDTHGIFGTPGNEIWYGGRTDVSDAKMDDVWSEIETHTPNREADFPLWPAGVQDMKEHLFLTVDDMTEEEANDLVAMEVDETDPENPVTIRKRIKKVNWPGLFPMDVPPVTLPEHVTDVGRTVDVRGRTAGAFRRNAIVEDKP